MMRKNKDLLQASFDCFLYKSFINLKNVSKENREILSKITKKIGSSKTLV